MNKLLSATALAAVLASPAFAADLPARTYTKAPMMAPAPVYDWSGFYLGGQVGGAWTTTDFSRVAPVGALAYSAKVDSAAGGGFVGVQKQFGQFVLGVEGGYVTGFGHDANFATPSVPIFAPGGSAITTVKGFRDVWSIGARGGYAINNWMPYVTGGYANGKVGFAAANVATAFNESASARLDGYYIGGGVDWAFAQNWVLGAEYRHYDFQDKTVAGVNNFAFVETINLDGKADTFMGRLSYKFNWGGPVVANY